MIKIKQTVIVEGKYDKIKLEGIISANIITTEGFKIYNNTQKQALIRNLAKKTGIIILTDSDSAGRRIRNFIRSCVGGESGGCEIVNVYLPRIPGKEKRKNAPSAEKIVGVEGTGKQVILKAFERFGYTGGISGGGEVGEVRANAGRPISKADFYADGLSGGFESAKKRGYLCARLDLPPMSANALVEAVNIISDLEEYKKIIAECGG